MAKLSIIVEKFDNIYKFMDIIEKRQNNGFFGRESMQTGYEKEEFTKTKSYEEAVNLFSNGLPEIAAEVKKDIQKFTSFNAKTITKTRPFNYYYGYAPNIPAAIIGLPKSMIYTKKTPQKIKAITLYYLAVANAHVEAETLLNTGKTVLQLISYLEQHNIRVNLYIIPKCSQDEQRNFACIIKLKDFQQPLDLLKVSFPLTHPSMFRRFGFKWAEGLEGFSRHVCGYGCSMNTETALNELKPFLDNNGNNCYICNYQNAEAANFNALELANLLGIKTGDINK